MTYSLDQFEEWRTATAKMAELQRGVSDAQAAFQSAAQTLNSAAEGKPHATGVTHRALTLLGLAEPGVDESELDQARHEYSASQSREADYKKAAQIHSQHMAQLRGELAIRLRDDARKEYGAYVARIAQALVDLTQANSEAENFASMLDQHDVLSTIIPMGLQHLGLGQIHEHRSLAQTYVRQAIGQGYLSEGSIKLPKGRHPNATETRGLTA